jgi:hypothetical protein
MKEKKETIVTSLPTQPHLSDHTKKNMKAAPPTPVACIFHGQGEVKDRKSLCLFFVRGGRRGHLFGTRNGQRLGVLGPVVCGQVCVAPCDAPSWLAKISGSCVLGAAREIVQEDVVICVIILDTMP